MSATTRRVPAPIRLPLAPARIVALVALAVAALLPDGRPAVAQRVEGTVEAVDGSDRLMVQVDGGATLAVQYIGVRGPVRSSLLHADASAFHAGLALGKRVALEADGKDEEAGWVLRHAYLEGDASPLSATVVAEGWANAAPYPLGHRHRLDHLQAREQAMAEQRNIWQTSVQGPSAPWRPLGSDEPGYVAADPELHAALELLATVPTGQSILTRLVRMAPAMLLRDLPAGTGGYADPLGYYIVMSRRVGTADPRAMAAAIAHEATHVIDFTAGAMELAQFSCFELEQRSHGVQAQVWSEFFGPNGKVPPQDEWDRISNDILRFAQRGDMENYVRRSAGYEAQCARERLAS